MPGDVLFSVPSSKRLRRRLPEYRTAVSLDGGLQQVHGLSFYIKDDRNDKSDESAARSRRLATQMVHGGTSRTGFGETSEALILSSGFVYERAENAEARFKNEEPGFQYSRFGNPTVQMFEDRMALLEGAEAARATATGMAAVFAALVCQLRAGDHVVSSRALVRIMPFYCRGVAAALWRGHNNH